MSERAIKIDGCVQTNLTEDEWTDEFIEWLESRGECFGGGIQNADEKQSDQIHPMALGPEYDFWLNESDDEAEEENDGVD